MKITKDNDKLIAKIEGKLDRTSSPEFEKEIMGMITDDINVIVLDLGSAIYVSSAGLRTILALEKTMAKRNGKLSIVNVPQLVKEVFAETGLDEILTLE